MANLIVNKNKMRSSRNGFHVRARNCRAALLPNNGVDPKGSEMKAAEHLIKAYIMLHDVTIALR